MACRDAHLTGTLAYLNVEGQRVRIPGGPCKLKVQADVTTLRWGDTDEQVTSFRTNMLDDLVSAGVVEFVERKRRAS